MKSGYERGLLLELWLAKIIAWALFLLFVAVIVALIAGYRPVPHEGYISLVVLGAAFLAGGSESSASDKLKAIHEAQYQAVEESS